MKLIHAAMTLAIVATLSAPAKADSCDDICGTINKGVCEVGGGLCTFCLGFASCEEACERDLYDACVETLVNGELSIVSVRHCSSVLSSNYKSHFPP